MTMLNLGGTFRARTPEETLQVIKPFIERAGITRLADLTTLDDANLPVHTAIRPLSKNITTSQGKGFGETLSMCSAYMEAIEQYFVENISTDLQGDYVSLKDRYSCVDPSILQPGVFKHKSIQNAELTWTKMQNLKDGRDYYLPRAYLNFDLSEATIESAYFKRSTTGVASGNTLDEAICHSLLEIIERMNQHALQAMSNKERSALLVDLSTVDYPPIKAYIDERLRDKVIINVFDMTGLSFNIPSYSALYCDDKPFRSISTFGGYGAHVDKNIAICRALTEAAQSRLTYIAGSRDDINSVLYGKRQHLELQVGAINFQSGVSYHFDTFCAMKDYLLSLFEGQYLLIKVFTQPTDDIAVVQVCYPGMKV